MKHIEVVAAVFKDNQNKIYCAKRKDSGELALKWEFPGGKIEANESHQEALIREIKEELSVDIKVIDYIMTTTHQYNTFNLTMHVYYAKISYGSFILNEHVDHTWIDVHKLNTLDWAAADLPIVEHLMNELK